MFETSKSTNFDRVEALKEEERKLGKLMRRLTHWFGDPTIPIPSTYTAKSILVHPKTIVAIIRAVGGALEERQARP